MVHVWGSSGVSGLPRPHTLIDLSKNPLDYRCRVGDKAVNAEDQTTFVIVKNLRMRDKRDMHKEREREIGTKN
mgnify:CR=1 FL=1